VQLLKTGAYLGHESEILETNGGDGWRLSVEAGGVMPLLLRANSSKHCQFDWKSSL